MILNDPIFWKILRETGCVDESRGMKIHEFTEGSSKLVTFSKTHSYGEYIFDWAWADAYNRAGLPYYPKLTSMVPFTPATAQHFLGPTTDWPGLLRQHEELLHKHSSAHFLFTTSDEQKFLGDNGYILRDSFQYHFFNESYSSFDDFLEKLKTKKAKHILKERQFPELTIERLTGNTLTQAHADEMYNFYLMTIEEKGAIPYLTKTFFQRLFTELSNNVLYVRAGEVAGALFYYDEERIYGRYWGASKFIPNLHFELCFYQGIEFAIEKKIPVFEAGAQGEHKLARGFRPYITTSAHRINHPAFSRAIEDFVKKEREEIRSTVEELSKYLPFK